MADKDSFKITVELTEQQAKALAQMVKRFTFGDARELAGPHPEAYYIIDAILKVRERSPAPASRRAKIL